MKIGFCDICSLGISEANMSEHSSKHLKESAMEYARIRQASFFAPIKFNESIVITDPFIVRGK